MDSSLPFLKQNRLNHIFFIKLFVVDGYKNGLNWCMNYGLIASSYECPDCGRNMEFVNNDNGYEWQCSKSLGSNQHNTTRSVIEGSCFSYSHLNIYETLCVMYYWFNKKPFKYIERELGFDDETEIANSYTFFRETCVIDLINKSDRIGGKGVNIEMDVCKFGEMKYVRNKLPNGQWVFGGYEKKTKKFFIRIVEYNTKQEFSKVISEWVKPGSIIVSNCAKFFDYYSDEDFIQLCSTNSLTFCESARSKSIEAARSVFEGQLGSNIDVVFDSYLGEHIWRKKHDNLDMNEQFEMFLKANIEIYQPLCKDSQL